MDYRILNVHMWLFLCVRIHIGVAHTDGQATSTFSKSRSRKTWPTDVASLMLVACLVVGLIQRWIFAFPNPLWPCINVKVIATSTSRYMPCISLPSYQVYKLQAPFFCTPSSLLFPMIFDAILAKFTSFAQQSMLCQWCRWFVNSKCSFKTGSCVRKQDWYEYCYSSSSAFQSPCYIVRVVAMAKSAVRRSDSAWPHSFPFRSVMMFQFTREYCHDVSVHT